MMLLRELVRAYVAETDNTDDYNACLAHRIQAFSDFVGYDLSANNLNHDLVNRYLTFLVMHANLSASTVAGYRRNIVTIWIYASQRCGIAMPDHRRIKKLKVKLKPPVAFFREEVAALIESAKFQPGVLKSGIQAGPYWAALICAAFDTGIRKSDILKFPSSIANGEPFVVGENKSGQVQIRQLSPIGCELLKATKPHTRELAYEWLGCSNTFGDHFKKIAARAKVTGTFKKLRSTFGSYAGTLGHASPGVFTKFYDDPRISRKPVTIDSVSPPTPSSSVPQTSHEDDLTAFALSFL